MTRSEWICNDCGDGFETKGKRDSHRERRHRQKTLIGIEKQRAERSENGKFVCRCGRDYMFAPSLRRHQRNCKDETLSREKVGNDKDIEQGIGLNFDEY
jgi:hypothetical protein